MRKILLSSIAAVGLLGAVPVHACDTGYICGVGVPVWGGNGPNCSHYAVAGDSHIFAIVYSDTGNLAGDEDLRQLRAAASENRSVTIWAIKPNGALCNLNVDTVLEIKGVVPN